MKHAPFGSSLVGAEPGWYRGEYTPYYTASHAAFRAKVREFVETLIRPNVDEYVDKGQYDMSLHRVAHERGISTVVFPKEFGGAKEDHDYFHRLILWDELARCGGGMAFGQLSVNTMALPLITNFGSDEMKQRVAPAVVRGEKFISLAVSEPHAGSDIMNLRTTAVESSDGKSYTIAGVKKWISGGAQANYFVVAARTGEPGIMGLTLFLVERDRPGVGVRRMKTQFDSSHSTAMVTFEDVVVPAENVIGDVGAGFMAFVTNVNSERFTIAVSALRCSRMLYEETLRWAMTRETFGKKLISHQMVRYRLAEMLRHIEQLQDQVERVAFQFNQGVPDTQMGIACALLKVNASTTYELCARDSSTIFGGSSIVREGQGKMVERLYREVNTVKIPGGAADVLLEFAMKDVERKAKKAEKKAAASSGAMAKM